MEVGGEPGQAQFLCKATPLWRPYRNLIITSENLTLRVQTPMQPRTTSLHRTVCYLSLFLLSIIVSLALLSCGGSTSRGYGGGTTQATASSGAPSGSGGSPGTGGSGGSGGSGGGGGSTGGGTGSGGGGGSGSSGSGSGSGGSGGTGGSGGSGGSGSGGSGGGSSPIVIQSFSKAQRLGGGNGYRFMEEALVVGAKGNVDLAVAHGCCLDPYWTLEFLRFTPGATAVTADTQFAPYATDPQVAEDSNGSIYMTWLAWPPDSLPQFNFVNGVFSRSDDGGATFTSPPVPVFSPGGSPHMALDSTGDIFVVWASANAGASSQTIMFSRSTDGGKKFSAGTPLSDASKIAQAPHIAVTSVGRIDVIWQYDSGTGPCDSSNGFASCSPCDIWYTQSADGGTSFSAAVNVSKSSGCAGLDGTDQGEQQMQIDSKGNVNIVWDDSIAGVTFRHSTDGGSTFSSPAVVSPLQGVYPKVAVDSDGNIYVVWAPKDGSSPLLFSRSTDGGAKFSDPVAMGAANPGGLSDPQIAISPSGDIDVLWGETHRILFSQSFDHGGNFSSPIIAFATDTTDYSDVTPDIFWGSSAHMVVEPTSEVDLAFDAIQYAGNEHEYLWFSHGSTSAAGTPAPLSLSTFAPPGTAGKSYDGNASPSGGTPPYSVTAAGLPPGLSLANASTNGWFWYISGTPTTPGNYSASFTVKDSTGLSSTNTVTITIAASGSSIRSSAR